MSETKNSEKPAEKAASQSKNKTAMKKALAEKPLTVPEIAEKTGIPAREVLWLMTSLRKYGEVNEAGIDGDYPRYELVKS